MHTQHSIMITYKTGHCRFVVSVIVQLVIPDHDLQRILVGSPPIQIKQYNYYRNKDNVYYWREGETDWTIDPHVKSVESKYKYNYTARHLEGNPCRKN